MNLDEMLKDLSQPIEDQGFTQKVMNKIALAPVQQKFPWEETTWAIAVSAAASWAIWQFPVWKGIFSGGLSVAHGLTTGHSLLVGSLLFMVWIWNEDQKAAKQKR